MKKLMLVLMAFGIAGATFAQRSESPRAERNMKSVQSEGNIEERAKKKTEYLTKVLSLTEEQQKQVYELHLTEREALKKANEQRSQMREEAKERRQTREDKMSEILTPEQMEKWQAEKQQRKERSQHQKREMHKKEMRKGDSQRSKPVQAPKNELQRK